MNKIIAKFEIALRALNRINSGYITAHNKDKVSIAESALSEIKKIDSEDNGMLKINIDSAVELISFNHFTESQLSTIIENAIVAINKKKAERQGETVDVGFWDGEGEYMENCQKLTPEEIVEIGKNAEVRYVKNNND